MWGHIIWGLVGVTLVIALVIWSVETWEDPDVKRPEPPHPSIW